MGLFTNIDWRIQVTNLLPPVIRGSSLIDLITALLSGLKTDSDSFATFEDDTLNASKYNSQKMVLQYALNQIFSVLSSPYIIVETLNTFEGEVYMFDESDGNVSYVYAESDTGKTYSIWAFNESDVGAYFNFIIKIPSAIYTPELERQVRTQVNKYKLTGTTYNVITY